MTDKLTIEYVRPEGLPEDAVPFVAFVGVADEGSGFFPTYHPDGEVWSLFTESSLRQFDLPVPDRTYEVTVRLTEAEVKARTSYFHGATRVSDPYALTSMKYNSACLAVLAAIEAGEA